MFFPKDNVMYVTLSDSISKSPRWTFSLDNCSSWIYTFDAIHPFFLLWKLKLKQMLLKLRPNSGAPSQPAFYKIDCDWISGEVKENWPIDTTSMKMVWWLYLAPATYLVSPHQVLLILREKPFVVARSSSLVAGDNNRHYYYSFQGHNRVKCSW